MQHIDQEMEKYKRQLHTKNLKKKKSGQAADSSRRYIYARQLSFLQQAGAMAVTQSSLGGDDNDNDEHDEELGETSENANNTPEPPPEGESEEFSRPPRYNNKSKKRKTNIESSLIEFMKTPVPVPASSMSEPNSDQSFFQSLLPSISSFTEDQKLEFRCDVLNIIRRIRNQTHTHSLPLQSAHQGYLNIQRNSSYPHIPNQIPYQPPSNTFHFPTSQYLHSQSPELQIQTRPHSVPLTQSNLIQPISPPATSTSSTWTQSYSTDEESLNNFNI